MKIEIIQSFYKGFIIFFISFYFRVLFDTSVAVFVGKIQLKLPNVLHLLYVKHIYTHASLTFPHHARNTATTIAITTTANVSIHAKCFARA